MVAMAVAGGSTTVRQVKRHSGRPKNVNADRQHPPATPPGEEAEVGGPVYKPVPPPKPAPPPPPYRMPPYHPLYYGEPPIPGAAPPTFHPQTPPFHTHSSKFPIEREVILSSTDKNSKIPILNEYRKRAGAGGAVAPDAPHVQLAWQDHHDHRLQQGGMEQIQSHPQDSVGAHQLYKAHPMTLLDSSRGSEPSPINGYPSASTGAVPRTPAAHSTPEGADGGGGSDQRPFPARTYHTIKDIISSRFQRRTDKVEQLSPQSQLRQHGVYLASTPGPSSAEITRRNREIQQQLIKERTHETRDGGCFLQAAEAASHNSYGGGAVVQHAIETETPPLRGRPLHTPSQLRSGQSEPLYGRTPASNWSRDGGVPRNRHSVIDADNARKLEEARREEERRHARTPEAGRRMEFGRTVAQRSRSVERLDCGGDRTDDDDGGFKLRPSGGAGAGGGQSDSGRGSTVYSSGKAKTDRNVDTSPEPPDRPPLHLPGGVGGESSQWVDMVESELRHILEPKLNHLNMASSTLSESISSMTPPLPPLSPGPASSDDCPGLTPMHHKHKTPLAKSRANVRTTWSAPPRSGKDKPHRDRDRDRSTTLRAGGAKLPLSGSLLCSSQDLELDSMLDDEGDNSSDDEEESTTVDIRRQLEGLENMYSEVLKLLGVKGRGRYQPSRRRPGGSLSSLPSSASSRPTARRTTAHAHDQRKNKVKDIKGINKRFQRLESHVVTLARSVAHLSSEMRTQHLMIQEMEVIRGELAALRTQSNMAAATRQLPPHLHSQPRSSAEQANSQPERVRKLTKFFGDEPPLLRLFLKKLGYEKYAALFEAERVGLVELPYLTEERLHRLGVPLGPRLRIMQEAQIGIGLPLALHDNTLCIV